MPHTQLPHHEPEFHPIHESVLEKWAWICGLVTVGIGVLCVLSAIESPMSTATVLLAILTIVAGVGSIALAASSAIIGRILTTIREAQIRRDAVVHTAWSDWTDEWRAWAQRQDVELAALRSTVAALVAEVAHRYEPQPNGHRRRRRPAKDGIPQQPGPLAGYLDDAAKLYDMGFQAGRDASPPDGAPA
jgi:hypothetical protein